MCAAKSIKKQSASNIQPIQIEKIDRKTISQQDKIFSPEESVLSFAYILPYKEKANETYMSANQLKHFQHVLLAWQEHLVEQARDTIEDMRAENKVHADPFDAAAHQEAFDAQVKSRNRDRMLMKKITQTLNKIEDGTYGFCEDTGEPIGLKRLEARPIALYSVEAQTKHERNKKLFAQNNNDE